MAGTKKLSATDFSGLKGVNLLDGTAATDAATKSQVDAAQTYAASRANHTGTATASSISDFDTQVRTSRLDQMAAPTSPVSLNTQRQTNLGAATADTDSAQWGQVKDLISGRRKADVKIVTTANDTLTGLAARDGITPIAGDRVLVTGQTTASANGIYDAASGAWTRSTDADAAAEFSTAWLVTVTQGTVNADTVWQHTTDGTITLGTTSITIAKLGPLAAGPSNGYTVTCPAVSAGNPWTVSHNLGTRALLCQVARVASPYDIVDVRIERTTLNTVSVLPDVALSTGEYECQVYKIA